MSVPFDEFNWDSFPPEPQAAIPTEPGMKLELRNYDVRENSKGDKVPLETGKIRDFPAKVDKDHDSAIVVTKTYNSDKILQQTELVIRSPHIRSAMASVIKKYPGMSLTDEKITVIGEPRCLFHFRKELLAYGRRLTERVAAEHVAFALNYMQKTLANDLIHYNNCIAKHNDTPSLDYDRLWMQYRPGDLIFVKLPSISWIGRLVKMTSVGYYWRRWRLSLERIIWTGSELRYFEEDVYIQLYDGLKRIKDLLAFPLRYHPENQSIKQALLDRGHKYLALRGIHQRYYAGTARWASDRKTEGDDEDDCQFEKFKVRSRVMIDAASFCEARPVHSEWDTYSDSKIVEIAPDFLSDEQKLIYNHEVYGFSLTDKRWCVFALENLQEVDYDANAFHNLRLPVEQKDTLLSLAKVYTTEEGQFDDFIKGKGKGMIVLLHGEPGLGKTLTAESIADHTERPLYPVRSCDLGIEASTLEKSLNESFEMAAKWNAIILLDEADVYLEQRRSNELQRNALVAVFLRLLEYYEGIMFLTTNRIEQFDPAFKSRIHLTLKYNRLSVSCRRSLWETFILAGSRDKDLNFDDDILDELSLHDLNGREIRNIVRTAYAIARCKGSDLTAQHLRTTVTAMAAFEKNMSLTNSEEISFPAQGDIDARSYKRPRLS